MPLVVFIGAEAGALSGCCHGGVVSRHRDLESTTTEDEHGDHTQDEHGV